MNASQVLFLALYVAGIGLFIVNYLLQARRFSDTGNEKYSPLKYFPFELNMFRRDNRASYVYPILNILASLCLAGGYFVFAFDVQTKGGAATSAYIMAGIYTIAIVIFNITSFIKLINYKNHLIFASMLLGSSLLLNLLSGFFFLNQDITLYKNNTLTVRIVAAVLCLSILIFQFVLIFNKNYANWNRLVKVEAENYARPKKCYLAIIEWGSFVSLLAAYIPLLVMYFF